MNETIEATCHCGAVRVTVPGLPREAKDCNCSLCRRLGAIWAYYTPAEVHETSAPEATETYVQGDRTMAVHRCRTCGCVVCWRGLGAGSDERMAVNARLFPPAVVASMRVRKFDGADTWSYLDED